MDRGREQNHVRLPGKDSRAQSDQRTDYRFVELRKVRSTVPGGRQLFFFQEQRPAESKRIVCDLGASRRCPSVARSEHTLFGWNRCSKRNRSYSKRKIDGLWSGDCRIGLAGMEGARDRIRKGSRR